MKVIRTNKFSDVSLSIRSIFALDRHTITAFNLLTYMLQMKTEKFPTKQALATICSDAYATRTGFTLSAYGKQIVLDFRMQYIRSDWIDNPDYEPKVRDIMDQLLFHPILDQTTLDEAKYLLENRLKRQMDDPFQLTIRHALDQIPGDHSIAIPVNGRIEDIEAITLNDIRSIYTRYVHAKKHVYVVGAISDGMESILTTWDDPTSIHADFELLSCDTTHSSIHTKQMEQTSIGQVYSTSIGVDSPLYYPLLVMNSILGQSPNSLLFEEIREKHSYCYSIFSSLVRFDGALYIYTGTRKKYERDLLRLIQEQIQTLCEGSMTERQLDIAKKDLQEGLMMGQDSAFSLIEQSYLDDIMQRALDLDRRLQAIQNVSIEQVRQAACRLHLVSLAIVEEQS